MASQNNLAALLVHAAVPAFKCPAGTKMHILDLGTLEADESWFVHESPQTRSITETEHSGYCEAAMRAH